MTRAQRHIFTQSDLDEALAGAQYRILADCGELVTLEPIVEGDERPICGRCSNLLLIEVARGVETQNDMLDRLAELEELVGRARQILRREGPGLLGAPDAEVEG